MERPLGSQGWRKHEMSQYFRYLKKNALTLQSSYICSFFYCNFVKSTGKKLKIVGAVFVGPLIIVKIAILVLA